MICPKCGGKIKVLDVRHNTRTNEDYRKRRCTECGYTFFTVEEVARKSRLGRLMSNWSKYSRDKKSDTK